MANRLQQEIQQSAPFPSPAVEALLSISRTADALHRGHQVLLKPHGITPTQYNVLRILRGAGNSGLPCRQIGERLVHQDPDLTRLLNRLEKLGLIERQREEGDRRVVVSRITPCGLRLLEQLSPGMAAMATRSMEKLSPERIQELINSLEEVRTALGELHHPSPS